CKGKNISPPLQWSQAPAGTRSFVLVLDDPDAPDPAAPERVWVHWVVYDLAGDSTGIGEDAKQLPGGARTGRNDWGNPEYSGPCPPIGRHRYFHKLYALDVVLPELNAPSKADVEKAMQGHVLAKSEIIGTYP